MRSKSNKEKTYISVANVLLKAADALMENEDGGMIGSSPGSGGAMTVETKEKVAASAPEGTNYLSESDFRKIMNESVKDAGPVLQMLADYDAMDN